jgi:peptidoglycan/LPS O-acetylase OafA/YrhL
MPSRPRAEEEALPSVLPRLTSLRAFAAVFVFTYHMQLFGVAFNGHLPFTIGYSGVSFFFILSGFVLAWSTAPGSTRRSFYRRRLARIYPTYVAMLVIAYRFPFLSTPGHVLLTTMCALLLVQAWAPHSVPTVYAVNPVSWSLSCEAFFYAFLPFLLPLLRFFRPWGRWVLGAVWFSLTALATIFSAYHQATWSLIGFTFPLVRTGEFVVGVVAAIEIRRGWRMPRFAAFLVIAGSIAMVLKVSRLVPIPDIELDPLFLTVIVLAAQSDIANRRGPLRLRPFVYAGEVSFAFYLVHQFVLLHLASDLGDGKRIALLSLVTAAAFAIALHHVVERPMQRLILGKGLWRTKAGPRRGAHSPTAGAPTVRTAPTDSYAAKGSTDVDSESTSVEPSG